MKVLKTLFIALAAALLLTGCSKEYYVPSTPMIKYDYDVRSSQWQLYGDCYCATLDVPGITRSVVNNGNVQVSRCYPGDNNGVDVWTPLPMMRVEVAEAAGGGDYFYTTYIDYEWTVGTVNIFVTMSDLYTGDVPADMSFRVFITEQ